jgi:glutathione S-transferase
VRLLGRLSSINVRKAAWACDEAGLAFEQEDWGTGFRSTREPEFLALNPNALIPVLVDGQTVLWESNTIVRYLAGKAGRTDLLPADPARRARVEQWMDWQATELNGAWSYAFLALVRSSEAHRDPEKIKASLAEWDRLMGLLDRHLAEGGPYAAGADFTVADIVLGLSTHRWRSTPHALPDLPALAAYYDRLCQRPAFRRYGLNGGP